MVKVETLDYKPKPIDENFLEDKDNYPVTGKHNDHEVRAEGKVRKDAAGNPISFIDRVHQTVLGIFTSSSAPSFTDSIGGWGDV